MSLSIINQTCGRIFVICWDQVLKLENFMLVDRLLGPSETYSLQDRSLNVILIYAMTVACISGITDLVIDYSIEYYGYAFAMAATSGILYIFGRRKPNNLCLAIS